MPQTLLLADDSVTIQRVIELTFADEDIKVVAVSDGDQAIAKLDAAPPDIVLADIGMPGKNGYEVAEYIKKSPRLAHIPVVLLTGAFEPVDQAKAEAAGCDGVLAKPFEPQLVISRVKELLAKSLVGPRAAAGKPADAAAKVDEYFDRLDAAFAGLSTGTSAEPPKGSVSIPKMSDDLDWFGSQLNPPPAATEQRAGLPLPPAASATLPDLPLSYGALKSDVNRENAPRAQPSFPPSDRFPAMPAPSPASAPPPLLSAPPVPPDLAPSVASHQSPATGHQPLAAAPVARLPLPPLADAFAALLAAEQRVPAPAAAPAWPAARAEGPGVTDDLVEQVTRRVLDRLSDRVVRQTVAELVSATAERLVREEIERIKASVK